MRMPCTSHCDWAAGCWTQRDSRRKKLHRQHSDAFDLSSREDASHRVTVVTASNSSHRSDHRRRISNTRRRGYRLHYRPVSVRRNYYSVPFPPPESLRLEGSSSATQAAGLAARDDAESRCGNNDGDGDGDSRGGWQDLEIRVIGHDSVVLWQDLQSRSYSHLERFGWHQPHRRKFAPRHRHQRHRQSRRLPDDGQPASSRSQSANTDPQSEEQSALLSIEAVICHRQAEHPVLPKQHRQAEQPVLPKQHRQAEQPVLPKQHRQAEQPVLPKQHLQLLQPQPVKAEKASTAVRDSQQPNQVFNKVRQLQRTQRLRLMQQQQEQYQQMMRQKLEQHEQQQLQLQLKQQQEQEQRLREEQEQEEYRQQLWKHQEQQLHNMQQKLLQQQQQQLNEQLKSLTASRPLYQIDPQSTFNSWPSAVGQPDPQLRKQQQQQQQAQPRLAAQPMPSRIPRPLAGRSTSRPGLRLNSSATESQPEPLPKQSAQSLAESPTDFSLNHATVQSGRPARRSVPSYMRAYSPLLQYPQIAQPPRPSDRHYVRVRTGQRMRLKLEK